MHTILLFYKYVEILKPQEFCAFIKGLCKGLNITGRAIIAVEGMNMTLEGTAEAIESFRQITTTDPDWKKIMKSIDWKTSVGSGKSFPRLSVKVRDEIVALKLGKENDINPNKISGVHLSPDELNKWYEKNPDDFVVIDMRNDYEYKVGHFRNSINPELQNFRDLPKVLPKLEELKNKKVVTVCTGGVRCEKASGFLVKNGFKDVYQLHGGMHRYMEKFGNKDFLGKLYVFDGRVVAGPPAGETSEHEVVGRCYECAEKTEFYTNCKNDICHAHLLVCDKCKGDREDFYCNKCVVQEAKQTV
jgi:UPF0176 protein